MATIPHLSTLEMLHASAELPARDTDAWDVYAQWSASLDTDDDTRDDNDDAHRPPRAVAAVAAVAGFNTAPPWER